MLAGGAASVVALALTVALSLAIFGRGAIIGLDSLPELACGVVLYALCMALVMFLCHVREKVRIVIWGLSAVPLIVAVCIVFIDGRAILARRLGDPAPASDAALTNGLRVVEAARSQVGVTVRYDASYRKIDYPGGDVPRERGVCSDVVVRALRDARGMDLQEMVHEDMEAHFLSYPSFTRWLKFGADSNIDHRRVPNLERFFERSGWALEVTRDPKCYLPGDIVTCLVEDGLPHIMVVSDRKSKDGVPLVIHNIGAGTREEEGLFGYKLAGHYRLP